MTADLDLTRLVKEFVPLAGSLFVGLQKLRLKLVWEGAVEAVGDSSLKWLVAGLLGIGNG